MEKCPKFTNVEVWPIDITNQNLLAISFCCQSWWCKNRGVNDGRELGFDTMTESLYIELQLSYEWILVQLKVDWGGRKCSFTVKVTDNAFLESIVP